jgi:hypothetical protein
MGSRSPNFFQAVPRHQRSPLDPDHRTEHFGISGLGPGCHPHSRMYLTFIFFVCVGPCVQLFCTFAIITAPPASTYCAHTGTPGARTQQVTFFSADELSQPLSRPTSLCGNPAAHGLRSVLKSTAASKSTPPSIVHRLIIIHTSIKHSRSCCMLLTN